MSPELGQVLRGVFSVVAADITADQPMVVPIAAEVDPVQEAMVPIVTAASFADGNYSVRDYFPMNNGDFKTFQFESYPAFNFSFSTTTFGGQSVFAMNNASSKGVAYVQFSQGRLLMYGASLLTAYGNAKLNFSPAAVLLSDGILGGDQVTTQIGVTATVGSMSQHVQATLTVSCEYVGSVDVPAGSFDDCQRLNWRLTVIEDGAEQTFEDEVWTLAPGVGQIEVAVLDQNLNPQGFAGLTKASVGGVKIPVPPLALSSLSAMPKAQAGKTYSFTFRATGGLPPYAWHLAEELDGLTLNAATGILTGKATEPGEYQLTIEVSDAHGQVTSGEFYLTVLAESVRPTISITSPKTGARLTTSDVIITGKATDNVAVETVSVAVINTLSLETNWMDAEITGTNWNLAVQLVPGTNTVLAVATDTAGNVSTLAMSKLTYVLMSPITLGIEPFNGGRVTGLTNGQLLEVGKRYAVAAVTNKGFVFVEWNRGSAKPALEFFMEPELVLTATFVENPFVPLAGTFDGLFYPLSGVDPTNSGSFTMTLTGGGQASGKILMGTTSYPFSGVQFHPIEGYASVVVQRGRTLPPLSLEVTLAFDQTEAQTMPVTGTVRAINPTDADQSLWISDLTAKKVQKNASLQGNYTFADYPGAYNEFDSRPAPMGSGTGTISVDAKGGVKLTGNLADGTALSLSSALHADGEWPVFAPLYGGRGLLIGWAVFDSDDVLHPRAMVGNLMWIKPPATTTTDKYHREGFSTPRTIYATRYQAPKTGVSAFGWTQGELRFEFGNLTDVLNAALSYRTNKYVVDGLPRTTLTITSASGLLSGSFINPATGKTTPFKGAILQFPEGAVGAGWFLGINEAGAVNITEPSIR
jgi:hypothetical protein